MSGIDPLPPELAELVRALEARRQAGLPGGLRGRVLAAAAAGAVPVRRSSRWAFAAGWAAVLVVGLNFVQQATVATGFALTPARDPAAGVEFARQLQDLAPDLEPAERAGLVRLAQAQGGGVVPAPAPAKWAAGYRGTAALAGKEMP